jgi:hypothetical protein
MADVSEQLAGLNIKELAADKTADLFNAIKGLEQIKDVVLVSSEGASLEGTITLSGGELG